MRLVYISLFLFCWCNPTLCNDNNIVTFDADKGYGRIFDGIGAVSGGGATSKLLFSYDKNRLDEIMRYLFQPNFGASLHTLKVEIGGDSQSTEGTEASHMHTADDLDCSRGYEGWLMAYAKKLYPAITLQGLAWAYPGWVGNNQDPFARTDITAIYIINWLKCMKSYYNLTIDYIGIWNEKSYTAAYIKTLRLMLNKTGFQNTKIVAADMMWEIAWDMATDKELQKAVYAIGGHYPGTDSSFKAKDTGNQLWASEDYSTFNNDVGAGCWARILNQNYVNGLISSTIAWNLVAAYFPTLPYARCSLMTAEEPWSGHYTVSGPVWITAHTTQFTKPGWIYLSHNNGVGHLPLGGSYVSLISPDHKDFTIVLETMSHDHSVCIRPRLPPYTVQAQNVTIQLQGSILSRIDSLHVWSSELLFQPGTSSRFFVYLGKFKLKSGRIMLNLNADRVVTLSTVAGNHGSIPTPPSSKPFPLPYNTTFQPQKPWKIREPQYLTAQVGYFELVPVSQGSSEHVLQQMVLQRPIDWCPTSKYPITLMGFENTWVDLTVSVVALIPSNSTATSIFVAGRVQHGGCDVFRTPGLFCWLDFKTQSFYLSRDMEGFMKLANGPVSVVTDVWYDLTLVMKGGSVQFYLDKTELANVPNIPITSPGFVGFGSGSFGISRYKSFSIHQS